MELTAESDTDKAMQEGSRREEAYLKSTNSRVLGGEGHSWTWQDVCWLCHLFYTAVSFSNCLPADCIDFFHPVNPCYLLAYSTSVFLNLAICAFTNSSLVYPCVVQSHSPDRSSDVRVILGPMHFLLLNI